jgi:FkbH-like protein
VSEAPVRVLVLADFTPDILLGYLNHEAGLPTLRATSPGFGQVLPVLADRSHSAWSEQPQAVVVWTRPEQVSPAFKRLLEGEAIDPNEAVQDVRLLTDAIREVSGGVAAVYIASWVAPAWGRAFGRGPLDLRRGVGISDTLLRMNLALAEALDRDNTYVLSAQRWIDAAGKDAVNPKLWYLAKLPFAHAVFKEAARDIRAALRGLYGGTAKLVVVDLDDTLWGGIVGDDGWENLVLGGHDPVGEALVDFQRSLKALAARGVLLGIVSKNTEATALEAMRKHPEMVLRETDFVGWRINWEDKARNLVELASELNLGLQSVVFIDDNPVERSRVAEALPEVFVPDWPSDKLMYRSTLEELRCFDAPRISAEDRERTRLYAAEGARARDRQGTGGLEAWLQGLQTSVTVEPLSPANSARVAQLLNKTNQMNLRTRRMSEAELVGWARQPGNEVWAIHVADRFGSAGLTGILSVRCSRHEARVEDLILSCRVMGRKIEETLLHVASLVGRRAGMNMLEVEYLPTAKNGPCLEMLRRSGLRADEGQVFRWELAAEYPLPSVIALTWPGPRTDQTSDAACTV